MCNLSEQIGGAFPELLFKLSFERSFECDDQFRSSNSRYIDIDALIILTLLDNLDKPLTSFLGVMAKRL